MALPAEFEVAISAFIKRLDERECAREKPVGWSPEEDQKLRQMWGKNSQISIARRLRRSRCSVKHRAAKLNLVEDLGKR